MKTKTIIIGLITSCAICLTYNSYARNFNGAKSFPELIFTVIPGAPVLSQPVLIEGEDFPVIAEGNGIAAPACYDWDGDGLKDLLIGEFGSGVEYGKYSGNFIRVYKNTGSNENPRFTGQFNYARPPFLNPGNGTPYSVDQFCCMGFTPQFVDLNNDGYEDMITGSYYGEVYWFKGSESGFGLGLALPQYGDPRSEERIKKEHQYYWLYSTASFGDLTEDGKPDLIVGGRALKISKNNGTSENPSFGKRELLLDPDGKPLIVHRLSDAEMKFYDDRKSLGYEAPIGGDPDISPFVTDWDNDGLPDILVTCSYRYEGMSTVLFFKGTGPKEGSYRFRQGIPLFSVRSENGKAFPGSGPRIFVTDWNDDGVKDLLIGVSIVTINNCFNDSLSWEWEEKTGILPAGKDPANLISNLSKAGIENYKNQIKNKIPGGLDIDDYITLRHIGYVYVMLGKK
jgi:hypothetical protein